MNRMIYTIIMQNSRVLGEINNNWIVIPVEYDDLGKITKLSKEFKHLRKEFSNFDEAVKYSKKITGSM